MKTRTWKFFTRFVVPAAFTSVGVSCAGLLFATRDTSERAEPPPRELRVEVVEVAPSDAPAVVAASGIVRPVLASIIITLFSCTR